MSVWLAGGNGEVHYFRQSTEPPPQYDKPENKTAIACDYGDNRDDDDCQCSPRCSQPH